MSLLLYLVLSGLVLALAYRWMGRYLTRYFHLDASTPVPAYTQRDGLDFEPAKASYLLPQHFSAIAAAGPVVGPIIAGVVFGWLPSWIWIIVGAILIGGVHDLATLIASVRHGARSIAEVVRCHMNRRSYLLFLAFIWVSLIYVIIAFADVTAGTFAQAATAAGTEAPGPAVATSSILYLLIAVVMGLVVRHTKLGEGRAKLVFLPLVLGAILVGPQLPFDLAALTGAARPQVLWDFVLLGYCFFAALAPVWLLLQPRGALGGYFLYVIMIVGVLGIVIGSLNGTLSIQAPAFGAGEVFTYSGGTAPLLPVLFITIACGACSGFHSIVASGTTSKQLANEADARPVAYGGMLLESFLACISLATVMILARPTVGSPNLTYADGIAIFMNQASFGAIPVGLARQFGLLCFATFVFDTLDACTRLARYVFMEFTGWKSRIGLYGATLVSVGVPALVLSMPPAAVNGKATALWLIFWNLFGSSNQLLAALALLAVTVWLARRGRTPWLTLGPTIFMLVMTTWSLGLTLWQRGRLLAAGTAQPAHQMEFWVALVLVVMSLWLVVEALLLVRRPAGPVATTVAPAA